MKELSTETNVYDGNYKTYTELINRLEDAKNAIKKQNYGIAMDILCKPYPGFQITTQPEVKEGEDARMMACIEMCLTDANEQRFKDYNTNLKECLAWLEKQGKLVAYYEDKLDRCACSNFNKGYKKALEIQGKQKPTDKVSQKFKVGDWITNGAANPAQISSIKNGVYFTHNDTIGGDIESIDKQYHLWTIKDAKDGDVLAEDVIESHPSPFVAIYKKQDGELFETYCFIGHDGKFYKGEIGHASEYVHPATKKQRDILIKAMADAGYTFDFEKKELKKIEQKHTPKHKVGDTIYYNSFGEVKSMIVANVVTDSTDNPMYEDENGSAVFEKDLIEQKFAGWSKEDEEIFNELIAYFISDMFLNHTEEDIVNWLKSLKDKIQPQSK